MQFLRFRVRIQLSFFAASDHECSNAMAYILGTLLDPVVLMSVFLGWTVSYYCWAVRKPKLVMCVPESLVSANESSIMVWLPVQNYLEREL